MVINSKNKRLKMLVEMFDRINRTSTCLVFIYTLLYQSLDTYWMYASHGPEHLLIHLNLNALFFYFLFYFYFKQNVA